MNMFKPTKAKTVKEYLDAVPKERKETILALHALIQKTVPTLKPHFASNMIGYSKFKYTNYKKDVIEWPTVALRGIFMSITRATFIKARVCA